MSNLKVSLVMPTHNRPLHTPMAIRSFCQQVYPNLELIIVDDGATPIVYPADARIKHLKLENRTPTGTKRNFGAEIATGEIIASLDDDDWSNPHRIQDQVQRLLKTGKAVTGYNTTISYEESTGLFYTQRGGPPYFASGTSQCYWKSWWKTNPFPDATVGEDWAFSRTARLADQLAIAQPGKMMVVRKHDNNTDVYPMSRYPRLDPSEISFEFFRALQNTQDPNYLTEPHVCTPECQADFQRQLNAPLEDAGYCVHFLPPAITK